MNYYYKMNTDAEFEKKLINLVEKYGKREDYIESGEKTDQENSPNSPTESNESTTSTELGEKYHFYYQKVKNEGYAVAKELDITKTASKFIYYLFFYNDDISNSLRKIIKDPDLYEDPPHIGSDSLYYCINDLRIRYQQDENKDDNIKRIMDFTEELFKDKYSKMEKMIDNNVIDFPSLWYYLDKIDTYYVVKKVDEDVCIKYKYFSYRSDQKNSSLVLTGKIIKPKNGILNLCDYEYTIKKFTGTKKLDTLKIRLINEEDKFKEHGEKILDWHKKIKHMKLEGKFYTLSGENTLCMEKNERVIVDCEGMDKYSNSPFDYTVDKQIDEESISDMDKLIIFPFISAYNLGITKRWGCVHINYLKEIDYHKDAFNSLVLEDTKKNIIKTLISQKSKQSQYNDFIGGKGEGLVFLLYGQPGTGKTLTVEATCEYLGKPLYSLSVGDLGTDPETMENIMNIILAYVRRWNAVIMIDECDIFLEQRQSDMITRNAMVGVFLKFLEYHDGIIFLTTNRLTTLDPAVKSRINLTLSYKVLSEKKRKQIWIALLNKWNVQIDESYINKLSRYDSNGREIRNYIKLAFSILDERGMERDGKSIIKVLEECFALTDEFNSCMKAMYT